MRSFHSQVRTAAVGQSNFLIHTYLLHYHTMRFIITSPFPISPSTSIFNPHQRHHTITQHRKHFPLVQDQGCNLSPYPLASLASPPNQNNPICEPANHNTPSQTHTTSPY